MEFIEGIGLRRVEATAIITLNNPGKRNAFYPEMRRTLTARIREQSLDPQIRAIVITGADGHFCTGADLSRVSAQPSLPGVLATRENMREVLDLLRLITTGPKPVIAAVEGDAFGAGCSIAVACDVVVATPESRFGIAFTKVGLVPDMGLMYTLSERIGRTRARRMMMSAAVVRGEQAMSLGIADEIAQPGGALARAIEVSREFESSAPLPVALIKGALGSGLNSIEDVIRAELDTVPLAVSSEDCREGIAANREKRKPLFRGC